MQRVLIAPITLVECELPYAQALRDAGFTLSKPKVTRLLTEEDLLEDLKGVQAVIAGSEPYSDRVLAAHPQLRVIARAGVGYDAVDVKAASGRGIAVTTTPGTNQDAVAEHTFALMLTIAKDVFNQMQGTREGKWPRRATLPLRGRTLGIAGLGRIGKAVALRGAVFGMKLLAYEPYPDHAFAQQHHVGLVSFEQLLRESDYVSLHLPLTPESKHLICKKTLALMKPTSFLINTARGGLVCEADLIEALRAGKIAGAGLDVFEVEPAVSNPLFGFENVVLTPHAAGVDLQSRDDMAMSAAQSIIALSRGQWPAEQVVNREVQAKFKW